MSTKSSRGGARPGAGRKPSDRVPKHIKLDKVTLEKIEDMLDSVYWIVGALEA
jgi:hypothetical protein